MEEQILEFLAKVKSADISTLTKETKSKRTTLLYQLERLIRQKVVSKHRNGKRVIYHLNKQAAISHFEEKIESHKKLITEIESEPNYTLREKTISIIGYSFGMTKATNDAILDAYQNGILTEVSMFINTPGFKDALEKVEDFDIGEIGLQFSLNANKTNNYHRATDFKKILFEKNFNEIEKLINSEFELFIKSLKKLPTFIHSHQGIHRDPDILKIMIKIAEENKIPIAIQEKGLKYDESEDLSYLTSLELRRSNAVYADYQISIKSEENYDRNLQIYYEALDEVKEGHTFILNDAGFIDRETFDLTSYNFERAKDYKIAMDLGFKKRLLDMGFKFLPFSKLK